jgi:hypothetical protein
MDSTSADSVNITSGWVLCENIGSLFINGLKKQGQRYEVPVSDYSRYKKEAKHRGIKLRIQKGQPLPTIIHEDHPYQFVLHNGIDHEDIIEGLGIEKVADDLPFPSPGSSPVLNSCRNRGATIGFAGSMCLSQNPSSNGIAEPVLIEGIM